MRTSRATLPLLCCLAMSLVAVGARADEADAELVEKVAVRNRLFGVADRWELGVNFGLSVMPRLVEHYLGAVSLAYNPLDWLGLELRAGYAYAQHSDLANQIQANFATNAGITTINDLRDLWELTAHSVLGVRFQPIYGKFNLVADVPIHFQFYLWAGAGVGLLHRESVLLCSGTSCLTENRWSLVLSGAAGFRFFVGPRPGHHAIKLEVRDYAYPDSFYEGVDRASMTPTRLTAGGSRTSDAFTNLVQFDLGYTFIF